MQGAAVSVEVHLANGLPGFSLVGQAFRRQRLQRHRLLPAGSASEAAMVNEIRGHHARHMPDLVPALSPGC